MSLSRGARRCLKLLQSYARVSGRAFPYRDTLARRLECHPGTVGRYLSELKAHGLVKVRQRQHSSAEYEIQDAHFAQADAQADAQAERFYPLSERKPMSEAEAGRPQTGIVPISESVTREEYMAFSGYCARLRIAIPSRELVLRLKRKFVGNFNGRPAWTQLPKFPGQNSAHLWAHLEREQVLMEMERQAFTPPELKRHPTDIANDRAIENVLRMKGLA